MNTISKLYDYRVEHDYVLRNNIRDFKMDSIFSDKFSHQLLVRTASIKIALYQAINDYIRFEV